MSQAPEPKSALVASLVFIAIVCAVFAVFTVVSYTLYYNDIGTKNQDFVLSIEKSAKRAYEDTMDVYRPRDGYTLRKPSYGWSRAFELESEREVVLHHPEHGIAVICVFDSSGTALDNLTRWIEQRMPAASTRKRRDWSREIGGQQAIAMELELMEDATYYRHWVIATASPTSLVVDIANFAGSFSKGEKDYLALLDSIRLLPSAPTATPLAVDHD